jgi:hypothetical protein
MISRIRATSERDRAARAAWQRHLAAWRTSGQTQAAYCRRHGVNEQRFSWWKRRLEKQPPGPARPTARRGTPMPTPKVRASQSVPIRKATPAFVPLTLRAPGWGAGNAAWACELAWADGRRRRFRERPTPDELRAYAAAW